MTFIKNSHFTTLTLSPTWVEQKMILRCWFALVMRKAPRLIIETRVAMKNEMYCTGILSFVLNVLAIFYLYIQLCMHLFRLFIYLFVYIFIYLFIYLLIFLLLY